MSTPSNGGNGSNGMMWGMSKENELKYLKLEIRSAKAALKDAVSSRDESLAKYNKAAELRDKAREAYENSMR